MCLMCQIVERVRSQGAHVGGADVEVIDLGGGSREERLAELARTTLDAVRAHAGDRSWVHGLLFRYCLDRDTLIELAEALAVRPEPFVKRDQDGVETIDDWPAVYEAVVTAATASFERHMNDPRTARVRSFGDLLTTLCGKPLDAEQRWIDSMRN